MQCEQECEQEREQERERECRAGMQDAVRIMKRRCGVGGLAVLTMLLVGVCSISLALARV